MDCPPVVLAGMIVRTIVFSRRNPISVILGRGGRARARRSEDQTLPTPFCTARAAPEYPVAPRHHFGRRVEEWRRVAPFARERVPCPSPLPEAKL